MVLWSGPDLRFVRSMNICMNVSYNQVGGILCSRETDCSDLSHMSAVGFGPVNELVSVRFNMEVFVDQEIVHIERVCSYEHEHSRARTNMFSDTLCTGRKSIDSEKACDVCLTCLQSE